jgi:hypothetical protein
LPVRNRPQKTLKAQKSFFTTNHTNITNERQRRSRINFALAHDFVFVSVREVRGQNFLEPLRGGSGKSASPRFPFFPSFPSLNSTGLSCADTDSAEAEPVTEVIHQRQWFYFRRSNRSRAAFSAWARASDPP